MATVKADDFVEALESDDGVVIKTTTNEGRDKDQLPGWRDSGAE